jgi:NAD-dependent deacetylase
MSESESPIQQLARWIATSHSTVVFTGAGMSTESGIPDFRSPGGIWSRYQPVYYDDFLASEDARYEYWRQKSEARPEFLAARPNLGHTILARWESDSKLRGVVTQNIDGLHQIAGSRQVLELHGTMRRVRCLDCQAQYDPEPLFASFLEHDAVPKCASCSGRLKSDTISFGQSLPEEVLQRAVQWSREADLFLACGSSLVVQPAASLPALAREHGARLVIINRDPTEQDHLADLVLHTSIGETLTQVETLLQGS